MNNKLSSRGQLMVDLALKGKSTTIAPSSTTMGCLDNVPANFEIMNCFPMVNELVALIPSHASDDKVTDWLEKEFTELTSVSSEVIKNPKNVTVNEESLITVRPEAINNFKNDEMNKECSIGESSDIIDDSVVDKNYTPDESLVTCTSSEADTTAIVENVLQEILTDGNKNNESKKKSRKRVRKEDKWTRNVQKVKLNTGKPLERKDGTLKPGRSLKAGCKGVCKLKCKITDPARDEIFDSFWKMGNITGQREFISRHMSEVRPKYRRLVAGSSRSLNYSYHFHVDEIKIRVCKKMFMETLDIGNSMIKTVMKKSKDGFLEGERRGKHGNQAKLKPDIRLGMRAHIESIPKVESHYRRADSTRDYIDGSLNISTLYRLYVEKCCSDKKPYGKKHVYRTIFNTEYNISLFKPKKDQCSLCEKYKNSTNEERELLKDEFECHIMEKDLSRLEKESDIKSKDALVAIYDFQAVTQLPLGEVSCFYYKRKLNTNNFTIYDATNKKGHCYMWHEGQGGRGANEVGSCIINFLKSTNEENIIFYSDNCPGQNKNKFIISVYLYCVQALQTKSIRHKYLVSGHTQNEGDGMHSCIEQQKKRALKSGPLYVPAQIVTIAACSKKTGNPYSITEMDTSDFIDSKRLCTDIGNNFSCNSEGEKLFWSSVREFKVEKQSPRVIFYKTSFEQLDYDKLDCSRKSIRTGEPHLTLKKAYDNPPKISELKKKDLLSLCQENLIPKIYHSFYNNL